MLVLDVSFQCMFPIVKCDRSFAEASSTKKDVEDVGIYSTRHARGRTIVRNFHCVQSVPPTTTNQHRDGDRLLEISHSCSPDAVLSTMENGIPAPTVLIWPVIAVTVLLACMYYRRARTIAPRNIPWVPTSLPWHETLRRPLTRIQAHLLDFRNGRQIAQEGYDKVELQQDCSGDRC